MPTLRGATGRLAVDVARDAARAGGRVIETHRADASTFASIEVKGRGNVATRADRASEATILAILQAEFPDHGVLAEESGALAAPSRYRWVIDPLDGTYNFTIGVPFYAVSIALLEGDEPILGVVYDPVHDRLYWAEKGRGAHCDDTPLAVTTTNALAKAVIAFDLGYHDGRARQAIAIADRLWGGIQFFRVIG
ncbi:MAG: hypothetical protein NZ518_08415, partial [Dehalococcoidia bacterium]|nr:hypothetical protein [Dehalococcoidia bacterium]